MKSHPPDIQGISNRHTKVFGKILHGVPIDRGIEHVIELEEGAKLVMLLSIVILRNKRMR